MEQSTPPPIPEKSIRLSPNKRTKLLLGVAWAAVVLLVLLAALRMSGLVRPFYAPTGAMAPAVSPGDHVVMEGVTLLARAPRRGDIVVFKTVGIAGLPQDQLYIKRVAGLPGDHVRISGAKLLVNDQQLALSNAVGEIVYNPPPQMETPAAQNDVRVPQGAYFVLGDNSTNSFDSRYWGCVPRENIIGRISFCYWPPGRVGAVK